MRTDREAYGAEAEPEQDAGRTTFDRGLGCVADEREDRQRPD
jgi:hypothetical protein